MTLKECIEGLKLKSDEAVEEFERQGRDLLRVGLSEQHVIRVLESLCSAVRNDRKSKDKVVSLDEPDSSKI